MANNTVPTARADVYVGDDQAFKWTPDITNDDSGIPLASWQVQLAFARGTILARDQPSLAPTAMIPLSYDGIDSFTGTLPAATLLTFQPGLWTLQYWRMNPSARKLCLSVELTVWGTVRPTTTSSTTTTTTTS